MQSGRLIIARDCIIYADHRYCLAILSHGRGKSACMRYAAMLSQLFVHVCLIIRGDTGFHSCQSHAMKSAYACTWKPPKSF